MAEEYGSLRAHPDPFPDSNCSLSIPEREETKLWYESVHRCPAPAFCFVRQRRFSNHSLDSKRLEWIQSMQCSGLGTHIARGIKA